MILSRLPLLALSAAALLSGCDSSPSEPSEGELKSAVTVAVNSAYERAKHSMPPAQFKLVANSLKVEVKSLRKIACSAEPEPGKWRCQYETVEASAIIGSTTAAGTGVFSKGPDGWVKER